MRKYRPPHKFVKKYKLMEEYHIPTSAVILIGMDKSELLARFIERDQNCNIYWSMVQNTFFPAYSPNNQKIRPNYEMEKYFQELGYINPETDFKPQSMAQSLNLINQCNYQVTTTNCEVITPSHVAAVEAAPVAAVAARHLIKEKYLKVW